MGRGDRTKCGGAASRLSSPPLSSRRGGPSQRPERYRISERLHRRQAMLPLGAGRATQQVDGARLRGKGETLPLRARLFGLARDKLAAEAQGRRRQQGNADHVAEDGAVAVPAKAGALIIS